MIEPEIITTLDYSGHVGSTFIMTEGCLKASFLDHPILKGVKFKIKRVDGTRVTIKISNTRLQLEKLGMFSYYTKRQIDDRKRQVKMLKEIINMWEEEPEKFYVDQAKYRARILRCGRSEHIVNVGYPIPDNSGNYCLISGGGGILTKDYKRNDDKKCFYFSDSGQNEYYNKACYEFFLKGKEEDLKGWEDGKHNDTILLWIVGYTQLEIDQLNELSFEIFKKGK